MNSAVQRFVVIPKNSSCVIARPDGILRVFCGGLAQLVERVVRNDEVRGSNPLPSTTTRFMDQAQLNWITNFIWGIADDTLRDVFVRGKYRDVILPMTVLRRLDAVLEPTKDTVLEMKAALDKEKITNQDDALRSASGQAFYNTSPFLLRDLKSRKTQQTLKDDFMAYLDGFSPNVQDILKNFEFRNQIPRLSESDGLGHPRRARRR